MGGISKMNSMIRSTVAAGKGQLLKASTRAVPLGSVADHSIPHHEGTSIALVQEVIEAKGGHVVYFNPSNAIYELRIVKKPKVLGQSTFSMSKALSSAGVPAAITGIGTASQVRFMSSNVPAPYGPAPRDLGAHEHKLHSDLE